MKRFLKFLTVGMSGLLILMLILLAFTGCGGDSESTVSDDGETENQAEEKEEAIKVEARYNPLFDEVFYPIANRDLKHDKDTIEKLLKSKDFTIEENKEANSFTISDEQSADEYTGDLVYLNFDKAKEGIILIHTSYISKSKDAEVIANNHDYEDAPENDKLLIHRHNGDNKGVETVETIDDLINFLKTSENE